MSLCQLAVATRSIEKSSMFACNTFIKIHLHTLDYVILDACVKFKQRDHYECLITTILGMDNG